MEPYLYLDGLKKLAKEVNGDEVIHIGIRPYGFHAGNALALIAYPYLLCWHLEREGKDPKFHFIISLNDWEQDALDGPDYRRYPFNIFPKNTSLQFTQDEEGCCKSTVDHWEPVVQRNVTKLKERFSGTSFTFVRNSEMSQHPYWKELLLRTINNPEEQVEIFKRLSEKEILTTPLSYAGAICPHCHRAHGNTSVGSDNLIQWKCNECGTAMKADYSEFQYWWYHKPMLLARMEIFGVDITLSGGDHYSEGDFLIRRAFIEKLSPQTREPKMLFTPTLTVSNGEKMSKSRNNTVFADVGKLIQTAASCNDSELLFTQGLALHEIDEKDYSHIF